MIGIPSRTGAHPTTCHHFMAYHAAQVRRGVRHAARPEAHLGAHLSVQHVLNLPSLHREVAMATVDSGCEGYADLGQPWCQLTCTRPTLKTCSGLSSSSSSSSAKDIAVARTTPESAPVSFQSLRRHRLSTSDRLYRMKSRMIMMRNLPSHLPQGIGLVTDGSD
mmetsp:Transcript_160776/g.390562  ORF Transcript_160776/g.390562 Transcript_160776/m.390562 type:complete len:164 (+) Transcript_160776:435-926(+)